MRCLLRMNNSERGSSAASKYLHKYFSLLRTSTGPSTRGLSKETHMKDATCVGWVAWPACLASGGLHPGHQLESIILQSDSEETDGNTCGRCSEQPQVCSPQSKTPCLGPSTVGGSSHLN